MKNMNDFKIGNKVMVVDRLDSGLLADYGDIGHIYEFTGNCEYPANVKFDNDMIEAMALEEIEIIKEEM